MIGLELVALSALPRKFGDVFFMLHALSAGIVVRAFSSFLIDHLL